LAPSAENVSESISSRPPPFERVGDVSAQLRQVDLVGAPGRFLRHTVKQDPDGAVYEFRCRARISSAAADMMTATPRLVVGTQERRANPS
jgi:hypothetical protein